jgi:hypothetical protein
MQITVGRFPAIGRAKAALDDVRQQGIGNRHNAKLGRAIDDNLLRVHSASQLAIWSSTTTLATAQKKTPPRGERWGTLTAGFTWSLMKKAENSFSFGPITCQSHTGERPKCRTTSESPAWGERGFLWGERRGGARKVNADLRHSFR